MAIKGSKITDLIVSKSLDSDKPVIKLYTGEVMKYGELIQIMRKTPAALEQLGVKPHERIALVSDNDLTYIPVILGIMECATAVPLETELNPEQYQENFELLSVDYLICNRDTGASVEAAKFLGMGIIHLQMLQHNTVDFRLIAESRLPSDQACKNDGIACIHTTSGTTSTPKVITKAYDDLVENIKMKAAYFEFASDSVQLLPIKVDRFVALTNVICTLFGNGQIVYINGANLQRIIFSLQNYPITHFFFQPAGMLSLIEYIEKNAIEYKQKHKMDIVLVGAPLPVSLKKDIEQYFNAKVSDAYGLTEVGVVASSYRAPQGHKSGSVGYPMWMEIRILEEEVLVRGLGVFSGYENDPDGNKDSFIDGWFRTGDTGYLDEDGYLFITGRIKELINRGGQKISPYEVEKMIRSLGYIKDITVFPYPNNKGYENVGAVIESDEEPMVSLRELRATLKDKIKPFKLPTLLYRVDKIPVSSSSGKVQRSFLYQQLNELGVVPESVKSSSPHKEEDLNTSQFIIREIWRDILDQKYVALDDNFFDIGGDSLHAAELLAAIETNFGCVLPVNEFFAKSTVRELAELVDKTPKVNPYKHIVPMRFGGHKPPIFFIHEGSGDVVTYHHIADHIDKERPVYGLNLNWQRETWGTAPSIRGIALAYVEEILHLRETGPYYLAGLSIGGQIAFEVGYVLGERQYEVIVFMLDTLSEKSIRNDRINKLTKGALSSLKKTPLSQVFALVHKKTGTLLREFIFSESKPKTHQKAKQRDITELEKADSNQDQLPDYRSIRKNHQPLRLRGEVCYFRALKTKRTNNSSYLHWRSVSQKFTLFESNCLHEEFVKPPYAADTAAKIEAVIEKNKVSEGNL